MKLLFQLRDLSLTVPLLGRVLSSANTSFEVQASDLLTYLTTDLAVVAGTVVNSTWDYLHVLLEGGKVSVSFGGTTFTSYAGLRGALPAIVEGLAAGVAVSASTDLGTYADLGLADGTVAVTALGHKYVFYRVTGLTAVPNEVILAPSGTGAWLREGTNPYHYQANWYIDPLLGNDANDGKTSLTALATKRELGRRLDGKTKTSIHIYLLNDCTETYTLAIHTVDSTVATPCMVVEGVRTTLRSGTLTANATTVVALGTGVFPTITDSTVTDWTTAGPGGTSLVGKLVVFPNNVTCIIESDQTGGVARVTEYMGWNGAYDTTYTVSTASSPVSGTAYTVVDFTRDAGTYGWVRRGAGTSRPMLLVKDVKWLESKIFDSPRTYLHTCALRRADVGGFASVGIQPGGDVIADGLCGLTVSSAASVDMAGVANVHAGYRIRYSLIGSLGGFFACRLANSIVDVAQYPAATSLTISYPIQVVLSSVGLIGCSVGIALSQGAQVLLQGVVYGTVTGAACSIKSGGRLWSTSARASYLIVGGASDVIVDATTYTYAAVDAASGRILGAVSGACINMPTI